MKNDFEEIKSVLTMHQALIDNIVMGMENIYNDDRNYKMNLYIMYYCSMPFLPEGVKYRVYDYFYKFFDEVIIYYEGEEKLNELKEISKKFDDEDIDINYIDIYLIKNDLVDIQTIFFNKKHIDIDYETYRRYRKKIFGDDKKYGIGLNINEFNELTDDSIILIANSLGCPLKYDRGIFFNFDADIKFNNKKEFQQLLEKEHEEYIKYIVNVKKWLEENCKFENF